MVRVGRVDIAPVLADFVANELTPDSGVTPGEFWAAFEVIAADLGPRYAALLDRRDELQHKIDSWHVANRENANRGHYDQGAYIEFLREIGYLQDVPLDVAITTRNVDPEITSIAAPQLVVPLDNARYALNAANARWGSFYDALYGTDVISDEGGAEAGGSYNPVRGSKVIAYAREFLDRHAPLESGSHADATAYNVTDGSLTITLANNRYTTLNDPSQFVGYMGDPDTPTSVLLRKHGLHLSIEIDRSDNIGRDDAAASKTSCSKQRSPPLWTARTP